MSAGKNIPLKMIRENLENIPQFALPETFSLRWFRPGDEKIWRQIQSAADKFNDITPELFRQQFGKDDALLATRQCYLLDARSNAIGTATAWFNDVTERGCPQPQQPGRTDALRVRTPALRNREGARVGRVHWVAILPEHQGKGLSKPLMSATCNRLRELGHSWTYLSTSSARIPAIKLYLKFGFAPLVQSKEERAVWESLTT